MMWVPTQVKTKLTIIYTKVPPTFQDNTRVYVYIYEIIVLVQNY